MTLKNKINDPWAILWLAWFFGIILISYYSVYIAFVLMGMQSMTTMYILQKYKKNVNTLTEQISEELHQIKHEN